MTLPALGLNPLHDDLNLLYKSSQCEPSSAITDGYSGNSFALRALMVFFSGVAMQNAILLVIAVFLTFTKFSGVYFYSLVIASVGVFFHALGFLFKFVVFTTGGTKWLSLTLLTLGWYGMVTGQSFVLWSRLHLLIGPSAERERVLRLTKWMIIIDALVLHIPTSVLTYGSNADSSNAHWATGYSVYEKLQLSGFCLQEFILSTLYIVYAARLLHHSMRPNARRFLIQLVVINVVIMCGDFGLIGTEAANLNLIETMIKAPIYSVKLMLEFVILGKLVEFVGGGSKGTNANEDRWRQAMISFKSSALHHKETDTECRNIADGPEMTVSYDGSGRFDLRDIADLSKFMTSMSRTTDATRTSEASTIAVDIRDDERRGTSSIRIRKGVTEIDIDIARFEHGHETSFWKWDQLKEDARSTGSED